MLAPGVSNGQCYMVSQLRVVTAVSHTTLQLQGGTLHHKVLTLTWCLLCLDLSQYVLQGSLQSILHSRCSGNHSAQSL